MEIICFESKLDNVFVNLAIEEYLGHRCQSHNEIILFLWQNDRSVVLGRNQSVNAECDVEYAVAHGISIARRLSGGGAVYHDLGNLNYTFICPDRCYSKTVLMEIVQDALSVEDVSPSVTGRNDIEIGGRKVSGVAFYERKDVFFLHGCILIDVDLDMLERVLTVNDRKIQTKGIRSVRSRVVNLREVCPSVSVEQMKNRILEASEKRLNGKGEKTIHLIGEKDISKDLLDKYKSEEWIYGTKIPVSFRVSRRFGWGCCDIELSSIGNIVRDARIYTDALETDAFLYMSDLLKGCPLRKAAIRERWLSGFAASPIEAGLFLDIMQCLMEELNIND